MPKKRLSAIKKYKKKNGETAYRFQIRIGSKGNPSNRRGFRTYEEAEIAYYNLREQAINNNYVDGQETITFDQLYKEWFKRYKDTVAEPTWAKTQSTFVKHILPFFDKKKISKISVHSCQQAVDDWARNLVSYRTVYYYAKKVMEDAVRYKYIDRNPFNDVNVPKKGKRSKEVEQNRIKNNFYEANELRTFLKEAKKYGVKEYAFFRLLAFTGMRPGEALALTWGDFNQNKKTIHVNKTIATGVNGRRLIDNTKTGSDLVLPINDETAKALIEFKKITAMDPISRLPSKDEIIFSNKRGNYYKEDTPRKWLNDIAKKANLHRITLHGFRHTHATLLYNENPNINPKDVQHRLGHTTAKMSLNVYTHVTSNSNQKIIDALNNFDNNNDNQENDDKKAK